MHGENRTTGALVWHLAMRWKKRVDREVRPLGLTHARYSALASLYGMSADGREPTQAELAAFTDLDAIYVSKLVRALEAQGLVSRSADPDDARAVRLVLTGEGRRVVRTAIRRVRALDRELTAVLGAREDAAVQDLQTSLQTLLRASE